MTTMDAPVINEINFEEVKNPVEQMKNNKSPGPGGLVLGGAYYIMI